MTSDDQCRWDLIIKYKRYVQYSNLLLVPWFFLGLLFFGENFFVIIWILLFILIFKIPLFFKVSKLRCPVCDKIFLEHGESIAFSRSCHNCGSKIGASC